MTLIRFGDWGGRASAHDYGFVKTKDNELRVNEQIARAEKRCLSWSFIRHPLRYIRIRGAVCRRPGQK